MHLDEVSGEVLEGDCRNVREQFRNEILERFRRDCWKEARST